MTQQLVNRSLLDDLQKNVDGEVRADRFTRYLYSTDGSVYEIEPIGVVFPRHETDILRIVHWANENRVPLLPRGAATSLAGQTVGRALILDFTKYLNKVVSLDVQRREMVVQPGIVCDIVNQQLLPHRLRFAPDPSTSNRATIGGMIANNASGARSIKYGTTADCIAGLRVVLANGEVIQTRPLALDGPELAAILSGDTLEAQIYRTVLAVTEEYADDIAVNFPDIPRNVSGYHLKGVVKDGYIDLTRLFCGSEGTLGIITEATLKLEPLPDHRAMVLFAFDDIVTSMEAVEPLRREDVSAIELMDRILLDLARETPYAAAIAALPEATEAVLVVEMEGDDQDEVVRRTRRIADYAAQVKAIFAEARIDLEAQRQVWNMRKAAVPLLFRMAGDPKPVPFIEDMAVSPSVLPQYVRGLKQLFQRHQVESVIYAHASVGCLHLRPILNLKSPDDVQRMAVIAREACELVMSLGGVMSGEHGDGLARTQWNRFLYGDRLWEAFGIIKKAFDPLGLLNPGKVYADQVDLTENLRYGEEYPTVQWTPSQDFSDWGSFQQAVELCNGCGHCRKSTGTMCPTFRALDEEIMTTRGRANLIRGALTGKLGGDVLFSEEFKRQVLDYCISCKGCRVECPSGVDIARLKAEILHHRHQRFGAPLWSQIMANLRPLSRLASAVAPVSNWVSQGRLTRLGAEFIFGVDRRRPLPQFTRQRLSTRLQRAGLGVPPVTGVNNQAKRQVLLLADCFVEHNEPEIGMACVRVLQEAGCHVRLAPMAACCGRPAISEGMLDRARNFMERNLDALVPYVDAGWDIVAVEPSCTSAFRQELRELLGFHNERVRRLSQKVFDVTEYLAHMLVAGELDHLKDKVSSVARRKEIQRITYHGHCHQKSLLAHGPTARLLQELAGVPVDVIDAGCCGMAGSFGYKKSHYDFSARLAEPVKQAIVASGGTLVASGTSCRTQFSDLFQWDSVHPVQLLDALLS